MFCVLQGLKKIIGVEKRSRKKFDHEEKVIAPPLNWENGSFGILHDLQEFWEEYFKVNLFFIIV